MSLLVPSAIRECANVGWETRWTIFDRNASSLRNAADGSCPSARSPFFASLEIPGSRASPPRQFSRPLPGPVPDGWLPALCTVYAGPFVGSPSCCWDQAVLPNTATCRDVSDDPFTPVDKRGTATGGHTFDRSSSVGFVHRDLWFHRV